MKYGIVVFPGSNCDRDSYFAAISMGAEVEMIWHDDHQLERYDCIILPGGFSYGDYLRAGSIARFSPIMKEIIKYADSGGLVFGICNGFQILLEANLLPGAMLQNKGVHFVCKHVFIKSTNSKTPFTNKLNNGKVLNIPIAHMDGNYFCDDITYRTLKENDQIVFQYCDSNGNITEEVNPNGSRGNIAGICNAEQNVFGMMPHPERAIEDFLGSSHGRIIFNSIQAHSFQPIR